MTANDTTVRDKETYATKPGPGSPSGPPGPSNLYWFPLRLIAIAYVIDEKLIRKFSRKTEEKIWYVGLFGRVRWNISLRCCNMTGILLGLILLAACCECGYEPICTSWTPQRLLRQEHGYAFCREYFNECWSQWPRGLRRRTTAARLLRSWVRIPSGTRMFVCCECCVLSGRGLCDELIARPEESYRLWCVVVCDLETIKIPVN